MRKVKLTLKCSMPSWNYCNLDKFTPTGSYSKELCRFCVKTRAGYRCALYDEPLAADINFVYKRPACIDATAGFKTTIEEAPP